MRAILEQVQAVTTGTIGTTGTLTESHVAPAPVSDVPLDQLCESIYEDLGVGMTVMESESALVLSDIERESGVPGSGRRALKRLCEHADATALPINMTMTGSAPKLIQLYQGLGFTVDPDSAEGTTSMVREPKP
jgi:hypothetical protein